MTNLTLFIRIYVGMYRKKKNLGIQEKKNTQGNVFHKSITSGGEIFHRYPSIVLPVEG